MKTTTVKILLSFIITAFVIQTSFGQDSSKVQLRVFGFGLHVIPYSISDDLPKRYSLPADAFIMTVNIGNVLRLEPEIGFFTANDKTTSSKSNSIKYGLGLYGMFQYGNLNMFTGAHIISASVKEGDNTQYSETATTFGGGPLLGGEYFVSHHFSFGGNIELLFASVKENIIDSSNTEQVYNYSYVYTSTGLTARFYF